jgi:hypothetical protein
LLYDKTQYKSWKKQVSSHHSKFWQEEQADKTAAEKSKTTNPKGDTYQGFTFADALLAFEPAVEPTPEPNTNPDNHSANSNINKPIANTTTNPLTVNVWRAFLQTKGQYHLYERISGKHAEEKRIEKSLKFDKEKKRAAADAKKKEAAIEDDELKKLDAIAEEKAEHTVEHQASEDIDEVDEVIADGEFDSELDNVIIDTLIDV